MPNQMNTARATGNGFVPLTATILDVWSADILFNALPVMKFYQFAVVKTELTDRPGLQIGFTKFSNLKRGGKLTEGVRIQTKAMNASQQFITVEEWGNAVGVSEMQLRASYDDTLDTAAMLLGRDYSIVRDMALRDVATFGPNRTYAPTWAGGVATEIAARGSIDGTAVMSIYAIKDAVEILAVNNVAKIGGDSYVCFVHPHQARDLRSDPDWVNVSAYAAASQIWNGEIGRIEDVRFIETTMVANGSDSTQNADTGDYVDPGYTVSLDAAGSASQDVYAAPIFGENFYGNAIGLPVEMRDDGVKDFGREHGLAWYSIAGEDRIEEDNGVTIETA